MGQDVREPPFFFAKPADAIVTDGGTVPYLSLTKDIQHEVELVVALKSGGRNIKTENALACIYGYGVGIDLTRRDLQIASRDIRRHAARSSQPPRPVIRRRAASCSRSTARCARTATSIR